MSDPVQRPAIWRAKGAVEDQTAFQLTCRCTRAGGNVGREFNIQRARRVNLVVRQMNLDEQFIDIRNHYFPQWDKRRDWRIAYGTTEQLRSNTGYCDTDAKVVYLDGRTFPSMSDDGQRAFIIHEICHDVGAAFHNRRWATRMERAAQDADRLGESDVAEILRSDIYSYFGNGLSLEYNAEGISTYLDDLLGHNPDISFDTLRKRISKFFGYRISKIDRDFGREIGAFADSFGIE